MKQNLQNVFEKAARTLYGPMAKEEQEEKSARNLLLDELGNNLTTAQKLYSTVDDLKKMKKMREENVTNFKCKLEDKGKFMTSLTKEEEKNLTIV